MKTQPSAWRLIPDFSLKLAEAMAYAGLSAEDLSVKMHQAGIETSAKYINTLLRGGSNKERGQPNPTQLLIAGIAQSCDIPAQWFFSKGDDRLDDMIARYGAMAHRASD